MKIIREFANGEVKENTIGNETNAKKMEAIYTASNSFHFRKDLVKLTFIK